MTMAQERQKIIDFYAITHDIIKELDIIFDVIYDIILSDNIIGARKAEIISYKMSYMI
jgi:hypothetical protein